MQAEAAQTADLTRAEARLPRWMTACGLAGAIGAALTGHVRLAIGFAVGASLGILNYLWLHQAVSALFAEGRERVPRGLLAKILFRYPLALAAVYLFYRTGWLPFAAVLAGLFVPVAGVLIEALVQLREGLFRMESGDEQARAPNLGA